MATCLKPWPSEQVIVGGLASSALADVVTATLDPKIKAAAANAAANLRVFIVHLSGGGICHILYATYSSDQIVKALYGERLNNIIRSSLKNYSITMTINQ